MSSTTSWWDLTRRAGARHGDSSCAGGGRGGWRGGGAHDQDLGLALLGLKELLEQLGAEHATATIITATYRYCCERSDLCYRVSTPYAHRRHGAAHPERDRNARVRGCAAAAASWAGLRRVRGLVCRYRHVADVGASLYCPYSRLVAVATAYSLFLACLLVLPWARWPCVAACHALGPFERAGGVCHRCLWGTVGAGAQFWVWWTGLRHVRPLESSVGEGGRGI